MTEEEYRFFRFNSFLLDAAERQLVHGEKVIPLTPKVFDTLVFLVRNCGHLVTKDELMTAVWPGSFVEEGCIAKAVHTLRKALGEDNNGNKFIETVPTKGYRFVAEVFPDNAESPTEVPAFTDESSPFFLLQEQVDVLAGSEPDEKTDEKYVPAGFWNRSRPYGALALITLVIAAAFSFYKWSRLPAHDPTPPETKLYWELSDDEKALFIRQKTDNIQRMIGDDAANIDNESFSEIKAQVDWYVSRKDSLSQEPFQEGLRFIYGRASQYVPLIAQQFESRNVPPVVGIYQAMIESEYRDCYVNQFGSKGFFQITRRTARQYGVMEDDRCKVDLQADAAARYMSDLLSDFGSERSSWTLALVSWNQGGEGSREQLRELRAHGVFERTYWAIVRNRGNLKTPLYDTVYVPRFFAAAIIGESPERFGLATVPLSTIRK